MTTDTQECINNYLATILDGMNLDRNSLEDLEHRRLAQKSIYIAQRMGVSAGYHFGWYSKGPFSSDLADDLDSLKRWHRKIELINISDESKKLLSHSKKLLDIPGGINLSQDHWVELLASLDYLEHVPADVSREKADEMMIKTEKFTKREITHARLRLDNIFNEEWKDINDCEDSFWEVR
jgi:uncharacterized protein YwgA